MNQASSYRGVVNFKLCVTLSICRCEFSIYKLQQCIVKSSHIVSVTCFLIFKNDFLNLFCHLHPYFQTRSGLDSLRWRGSSGRWLISSLRPVTSSEFRSEFQLYFSYNFPNFFLVCSRLCWYWPDYLVLFLLRLQFFWRVFLPEPDVYANISTVSS